MTVTEVCKLECTRQVLLPVCEERDAVFSAKALHHSAHGIEYHCTVPDANLHVLKEPKLRI